MLYGLVHFSATWAVSTLALGFAGTPWRKLEAELSTNAHPPVATLGAGRNASARAEFLRLTRETARAWGARTMSFARVCLSMANSQ